jgi:hypothetical protein
MERQIESFGNRDFGWWKRSKKDYIVMALELLYRYVGIIVIETLFQIRCASYCEQRWYRGNISSFGQ